MKISLLAHNLAMGGGLLIGQAITRIIPQMAPGHTYRITVPADGSYDFLRDYDNVELYEWPRGSYFERYRRERRFVRELDQWGCDWAWWLGNVGFAFPKCRQSVYLHSAYTLDYPEKHWGIGRTNARTRWRWTANRWAATRTMRHAQNVYTQTQTVANHLLGMHRFLTPEMVHICPLKLSIPPKPTADATLPEGIKRIRMDDKRFRCMYASLYCGHKNFERVVETMIRYRNDLSDVVFYLTLDPDHDGSAPLCERIHAEGLEEQIVLLGQIPWVEQGFYYQRMDCCLIPSLMETIGFGHIEAFAYDLPLVASDLDFAHEVCGDAACFVDPFSLESIRDGILRIKNDSTYREQLIRRGREQIPRYERSWEEILRNVLEIEGVPVA